jgi:hypothetical protein
VVVLDLDPELNVVAREEEHASLYHGVVPCSEAELTLRV